MLIALVILGVLALVLGGYTIAIYNRLIALKNHIRESWADIDTELKRRYDLIPNLVEVVKAYAAHERELLEKVVNLRATCQRTHSRVSEQARDEMKLVNAVGGIFALAESYPDLKADERFADLQTELVHTEDRIQAARRFYNANIRDFRNTRESFPSNIIAGMFGFTAQKADYFEADTAERSVPKATY